MGPRRLPPPPPRDGEASRASFSRVFGARIRGRPSRGSCARLPAPVVSEREFLKRPPGPHLRNPLPVPTPRPCAPTDSGTGRRREIAPKAPGFHLDSACREKSPAGSVAPSRPPFPAGASAFSRRCPPAAALFWGSPSAARSPSFDRGRDFAREAPPNLPELLEASLLDAKKILNLGIFLKQFKRPVQDIVADIHRGAGALYGPEKLLELLRMLPNGKEVERLASFQGDRSRLSEAELFALLLVQVPSYARRLELLVLQLQLLPQLSALQSALQILTTAALELLACEGLHDLLWLVLETGNCMNEGGAAGSACGFHISSLLQLADTKGNQPGIDLLHFVALEAERKDSSLLHFARELQHVGPASRIDDQEVAAELQSLERRLLRALEDLQDLGLEEQMGPFLRGAEAELLALKSSRQELQRATTGLSDFLCEGPGPFSLPRCCGIFQTFGERFLAAVEENRAREAAMRREQQRRQQQEQAKQKRRSIATCSALEPGLQDMDLERLTLWARASGCHSRPPRGPHPSVGYFRGRERPLHLSRRHTLTVPPPCPEPLGAVPQPRPPAPLSQGKKAGGFAQSPRALLSSPPAAPASSPASAQDPSSPSTFRFSALFRAQGPDSPSSPTSKDVCGLVGFLRRLSVGKKSRSPS